MKVCVLIPAYNEAGTIGGIVQDLKAKGLSALVVDDGSSDDTAKIAEENGALILGRLKNAGKGTSFKKGFEYILKNTDFDAVITMDGDGQHSVEDISKFIKLADEGKDFVVGNRMDAPGNMPLVRLLTNKIMSVMLSKMCRQRIPDTQCGFRLLKRHVLKSLKIYSSNYDYESEMLIEASRNGFSIDSVPVETIYRGEVSQIHPVRDTFRFFLLLFRSYFRKKSQES